jgi:uncharacterized protein
MGTYQRTRDKIDFLRQYYRKGKINFGIGVLAVVNPEFSAKKIYRHFVDELKLNSFDFLLPDNTWDSITSKKFTAEAYGRFYCELFDEWVNDNNPKIYIRILNSIVSKLTNKEVYFHDFGGWLNGFLLLTVSSSGDLSPDDTYRSADPELMKTNLTVDNSTFRDLINHQSVQMLYSSSNSLATECLACEWKSICKSGSLLHRYSKKEGFIKKTIYCEGLKIIYERIYNYLKDNNIKTNVEVIKSNMGGEDVNIISEYF